MITPRMVPVVSITGVVGLVAIAALAVQMQRASDTETQRDCERAVSYRDDNRAMWLYLIDSASPDRTPEEQKRYDAFVVELDERLPPLKCNDGDPVTATP